jgi:hypothetical protein
LTKENFRVHINGKPVEVLDARYTVAPRRIVVLLDMSGSMSGGHGGHDSAKWKITREVLEDLLAQMPGDVPIAMLTFAGTIREEFDFPNSRTTIAKRLDDLFVPPKLKHGAGSTALFDAILQGLRLLGPVQTGDALYAITDGGENASHASVAKTKAALLQSGVRLFAFLFREPSPPGEEGARETFRSLVEDSGGLWFGVSAQPFSTFLDAYYAYDKDAREKVRMCTNELSVQVNGFWTLHLPVPSSNKDTKMKLEVIGHKGRIGVTYPRLLPPRSNQR